MELIESHSLRIISGERGLNCLDKVSSFFLAGNSICLHAVRVKKGYRGKRKLPPPPPPSILFSPSRVAPEKKAGGRRNYCQPFSTRTGGRVGRWGLLLDFMNPLLKRGPSGGYNTQPTHTTSTTESLAWKKGGQHTHTHTDNPLLKPRREEGEKGRKRSE